MNQASFSPQQLREIALLKFELLSSGMSISASALHELKYRKYPIRTRSGASGGLDVILPHQVYVNVPVEETFAAHSSIRLDYEGNDFVLKKEEETISTIQVQPKPLYYNDKTSDGTEDLVRIGQICSGDRFCYGMTGPGCRFWGSANRCKFCSIGHNYRADAAHKKEQHLLEALERSIHDPILPAKHVLLGGGTPPTDDMGAVLASRLCSAIKKRFNISVYVMIAAPIKNEYIDMLCDSGADELGMNLEFWSPEAWEKYIPGKNRIIGKKRCLDALEYAVKKLGPINTRSILIAGLENKRYTIEGAVELAQRGVMPILSPFRPLNGTFLENHQGFDAATYLEIFTEVSSRLAEYSVPLGPTCIACQNNVLALPFGNQYRFYQFNGQA